MPNYNASKVRKIVESLATVYGIDDSEFMLTYGTAMVMHGLCQTTDDMDITVNSTVFDKLRQWITPTTDALGEVIWMPGAIEIRPLSTLRTGSFFQRINHCQVQTLDSLLQAYRDLQADPIKDRSKCDEDLRKINVLVTEINRLNNETDAIVKRSGKIIAEEAQHLMIELAASRFFEKLEGPLRLTIKDPINRKWTVTFNPADQSIEFYELDEVDMNGMVKHHKFIYSHEVKKV
jgi:hypothetical protein